jgi:hypothetical protein
VPVVDSRVPIVALVTLAVVVVMVLEFNTKAVIEFEFIVGALRVPLTVALTALLVVVTIVFEVIALVVSVVILPVVVVNVLLVRLVIDPTELSIDAQEMLPDTVKIPVFENDAT